MQTERSLKTQIDYILEQQRIEHNKRIETALASWRPYFQKLDAAVANNNQQQLTLIHHGR